MIASDDVRRVTFEKVVRGYRCEDVDDYLKQAADSIDAVNAENADLQKKLQVLARRIEQYRAEEDTLHTALINAQRLGENVIKEAKQKAADIIRMANTKAEEREQRGRDEVELSKQELTTLKKETSDFKKRLMDSYRKHLELISTIPDEYDEDDLQASAQPVQQAPATTQPEQTYSQPAPFYEEDQAEPQGEEKVDTVEFAIAPQDDVPPSPAPAPAQQAAYSNSFQPGAGLYGDEDEAPKPRRAERSSHARTTARKPRTQAQQPAAATAAPEATNELPRTFDSFSGIDFDS